MFPPRRTVRRIGNLLGQRGWLGFALLLLTITGLTGQVPVTVPPGYELGLCLIPLTLLGGLGLAVHWWSRAERPFPLDGSTAIAAAITVALAPLPAVALATLRSILSGNPCEPARGAVWLISMAAASGLVGLGLGALGAATAPSPWAAIRRAVVPLATWTLWDLIYLATQPPVFIYNPLVGYFAGPLYDPLIPADMRLVGARGLDVVLGSIALFIAMDWRRARDQGTGIRRRIWVVVLGALSLLALRTTFGIRPTRATIQRALGTTISSAHFRIHLDAAQTPEAIQRELAQDHEWHLARILGRLELPPPERPLHSYLYPSIQEKKRLMGAGPTSMEDPINREFHIHAMGPSHPILAHELAHVLTAPLGIPVLGMSRSIGLLEGAATALGQFPTERLTLHQRARALELLDMAPDLIEILSAKGFWSEPGARSYAYMGSFCEWLLETYGAPRFGRVYRWADFEGAYGQPLTELLVAWKQFLSGVGVDESDLAYAESVFRPPSLLQQPCVHAVARHQEQASAAWEAQDFDRAAHAYDRALSLTPSAAHLSLGRARCLRRNPASVNEAEAVLQNLGSRDDLRPTISSWARLELGDLRWAMSDTASARLQWSQAVSAGASNSIQRAADLRLQALEQNWNSSSTWLVTGERPGDAQDRASSGDAIAAYLLGLESRETGDSASAIRWLDLAIRTGLSSGPVRVRAAWELARALTLEHRHDAAFRQLQDAIPSARSAGDLERLNLEVARLRWLRSAARADGLEDRIEILPCGTKGDTF